MRVRLETARLLLYKLAWMKDQSQTAALEALTKLHRSECFVQSSLDAVRATYGGMGYSANGSVIATFEMPSPRRGLPQAHPTSSAT